MVGECYLGYGYGHVCAFPTDRPTLSRNSNKLKKNVNYFPDSVVKQVHIPCHLKRRRLRRMGYFGLAFECRAAEK